MVGNILKHMRMKSHLKQTEVAKLSGIGVGSICQYENETRKASFQTIEKIANACGYKIYFEKDGKKFCANDLRRKDV